MWGYGLLAALNRCHYVSAMPRKVFCVVPMWPRVVLTSRTWIGLFRWVHVCESLTSFEVRCICCEVALLTPSLHICSRPRRTCSNGWVSSFSFLVFCPSAPHFALSVPYLIRHLTSAGPCSNCMHGPWVAPLLVCMYAASYSDSMIRQMTLRNIFTASAEQREALEGQVSCKKCSN